MKNFLLATQILVVIAVAVLYFLFFNAKQPKQIKSVSSNSVTTSGLSIAYIDLDSINANVNYIKQQKKVMEAEQNELNAQYQNAYMQLENEKNNFLKKGNSITRSEAEVFQNALMQKQQEVESTHQTKGQKLAEKSDKIMSELQDKLKAFLNEYNQSKKYTYIFATAKGLEYIMYKDSALNITEDVIEGLNEKFK